MCIYIILLRVKHSVYFKLDGTSEEVFLDLN